MLAWIQILCARGSSTADVGLDPDPSTASSPNDAPYLSWPPLSVIWWNLAKN
jgi:hypothetical protein